MCKIVPPNLYLVPEFSWKLFNSVKIHNGRFGRLHFFQGEKKNLSFHIHMHFL